MTADKDSNSNRKLILLELTSGVEREMTIGLIRVPEELLSTVTNWMLDRNISVSQVDDPPVLLDLRTVKKWLEGPFACPGCGRRGTPEEFRNGEYRVLCKNQDKGCAYEDYWTVPANRKRAGG